MLMMTVVICAKMSYVLIECQTALRRPMQRNMQA